MDGDSGLGPKKRSSLLNEREEGSKSHIFSNSECEALPRAQEEGDEGVFERGFQTSPVYSTIIKEHGRSEETGKIKRYEKTDHFSSFSPSFLD